MLPFSQYKFSVIKQISSLVQCRKFCLFQRVCFIQNAFCELLSSRKPQKIHHLTKLTSCKYQLFNNYFLSKLPPLFFFFQRIEGRQISESLRMFGQSISGQIDADSNGYVGEQRLRPVSGPKQALLRMLLYCEHGKLMCRASGCFELCF